MTPLASSPIAYSAIGASYSLKEASHPRPTPLYTQKMQKTVRDFYFF